MSDPQRPHGLQPSRLLLPLDFPGKSIGVGCHCLIHTPTYLVTPAGGATIHLNSDTTYLEIASDPQVKGFLLTKLPPNPHQMPTESLDFHLYF